MCGGPTNSDKQQAVGKAKKPATKQADAGAGDDIQGKPYPRYFFCVSVEFVRNQTIDLYVDKPTGNKKHAVVKGKKPVAKQADAGAGVDIQGKRSPCYFFCNLFLFALLVIYLMEIKQLTCMLTINRKQEAGCSQGEEASYQTDRRGGGGGHPR